MSAANGRSRSNAGLAMPRRVRLSREKGWRMPPNTMRVDRATRFGNPFRVTEDRTAAEAYMAFETWLTTPGCDAGMKERKARILMAMPELLGKDLACWCKPGEPCHADVLLRIANASINPQARRTDENSQ